MFAVKCIEWGLTERLACQPWAALALNTLGGILAGLAFSVWSWLRRKLTSRRFKQIFGPGAATPSFTLVYAELALRNTSEPFPYVKLGGNPGFRFSISHPIPISEVRAAHYLASAIGTALGCTPAIRSDFDTQSLLDLDFVSFGGPQSNFKTADCQANPANTLAVFDQANNQFICPLNRQPILQFEPGFDYGLILKIRPAQFPRRVWLVCAGLGEWGTSGAAWFLGNKWDEIRRTVRSRPFAAIVRVRHSQDQSAEIVALRER